MPPQNAIAAAPSTQTHEIKASKSTWFSMGFFGGLGSGLATMIFVFIAMVLFIPGLIIVIMQNKKPKEDRNTGLLVLGFALMGLGVIAGMGMGFFVFADLLTENI